MTRTLSAGLSFLAGAILVPLALQAQSSSEDVELARSLAQRGWYDVAEEICDRVQKSAIASPANKAIVPYVMAEIQLNKAERESDVEKAKTGFADAVSQLRKFLEANPTHPMAQEARVTIGWISARKGRLLVDAMGSADGDKKVDYQKQAGQAYGEAEGFYQTTINELKSAETKAKEKLTKDPKDPALNAQLEKIQESIMDARLELPKVLTEHARLPGVDETSRKKLLKDAQSQLADFEFDYGDRGICFEAILEEGKCLTEMGDFKQAESRLRATLGIRESLAKAKMRPNDYHLKLIYGAHIALAQMYVKQGKLTEARAYVDQVLKEDKSLEKDWGGLALKLEKADALFRLKDVGGATALANEVIKLDPNGKYGYLAKEKMKQWQTLGGSAIRFSPQQYMQAADQSLSKNQDRDALISLRKCIEACVTDDERNKFAVNAYFRMGQVYVDLRRFREAAIAFENVYSQFPSDPQAAKACYECVQCYVSEFGITGDKRDEDQKKKFLSTLADKWPRDPSARNIKYIQASEIEKAGDLKKAGELYQQVGEDAEAYENALVSGGYCFFADAAKKWGEKGPKDATKRVELQNQLRTAEALFRKFLKRVNDPSVPPPASENLAKARENLKLVANQQLAYILMHDAIGKTDEALKFLEEVAKTMDPNNERMAKIWESQIRGYLAQKQVPKAITTLDLMMQRFPDAAPLARSCKSVAIKLDEATAELEKANGNQAMINDNYQKISRYYAKWLELAPALQMRITMQDVISVAETLYRIAKQLNGLDKDVVSFMDLNGKAISQPQYWQDAAMVLRLLTEGKVSGTKIPDREKIVLMTRLARCESFLATDLASWRTANGAYDSILKAFRVAGPAGIDGNVIQSHPELLGVYAEQGYVLYELGKRGDKFQYDNASTIFGNLCRVLSNGSQSWWQAKLMLFTVLFERGGQGDVQSAKAGLASLEETNPDFDSGKFGMKQKFLDLKKEIIKVAGK